MMLGRNQARQMIKDYVESPVIGGLLRLGISPNLVTIGGLVLSGVAAYFVGAGNWLIGGFVVLFAGIFDLFDGALARAAKSESRFGALLDSTVDRVSEAIVLLGLLVYYLTIDNDVGSILVYIAIIGSMMVSYLRARSEGLGIDCKVGVMTRPERVAVVGIGLIVGQWEPRAMLFVVGVIAVLTVFTTAHRLSHTWKMLKSDDSSAN